MYNEFYVQGSVAKSNEAQISAPLCPPTARERTGSLPRALFTQLSLARLHDMSLSSKCKNEQL